ncbi:MULTISPECIES: ATP-grasp domain-containing protein [Acinetobacter]|uniref:ATP-grasp domain-containing protein n=1 Tax=Acinetobacter TaxID=469 RepID=UPI0015D41618|nr:MULTISPECIES: hypothetical protein [Acinetobacter]
MKVAIHKGQGDFSERWIKYCELNNIEYAIVDAFSNTIISELKKYDIFMWHHHHAKYKDVLTAKRILFALEHAGIKVFPNFNTGWHFDDKVAQKYLLEAINAPLVNSYVFYDKEEALVWADQTIYPKVFKLKGGAGATNVKLVRNKNQAFKLINKAFGVGFSQFDKVGNLIERYNKFKLKQDSLAGILKGIFRLFFSPEFSKNQPKERGYIYFQDFIPNNDSDIRVIVIGNKCFSIKRLIRKNDFRASGSGNILYNPQEIPIDCIKMAFDINKKLKSQCVAYDFIIDGKGKPLIIEISYGFSVEAYDACQGYWDSDLNWIKSPFNPQEWMLEHILLCNS